MNAVTGLNHVTLAVQNLQRSVTFYTELLGFTLRMQGPRSAYLEAGTLWLALVVDARARDRSDYTHIAFSVRDTDLQSVKERLVGAHVSRWQEGNGKSFYFADPDGHKLELHSGDLAQRLKERAALSEPGIVIYD